MYTVHSRSHYTGLLWSVVRADYSNNTPLTHTCMERETGTVVGGAAGQRRDEVTERSMAGPSLESSPDPRGVIFQKFRLIFIGPMKREWWILI